MKKMVLLAVLYCLNVFSQHQHIKTQIEKDTITIGERLKVTFVYKDSMNNFQPLNWENQFSKRAELKEKEELKKDDFQIVNYTIASYDTGWISLPPFQISPKNDTLNIYMGTDSIRYYVKSLVPDSAVSFIEIKDPVSYPFPWLKWLGFLSVIVIAIILTIYLYKKYFKKEPVLKKEMIIQKPAHEIALEKLNKLDPDHINGPEEAKRFHFRLSYIFREYLENRFNKNYLEKTTYEIKPELKKDIPDNDIYHQVVKMLNATDEIKFARKEQKGSFHKETYNRIVNVIRDTMVKKDLDHLEKKETD